MLSNFIDKNKRSNTQNRHNSLVNEMIHLVDKKAVFAYHYNDSSR